MFIVCYDEDSKAPVNDWFKHTVVNDDLPREKSQFNLNRRFTDCCGFGKKDLPEIRGPFILIKPTMKLQKSFVPEESYKFMAQGLYDENPEVQKKAKLLKDFIDSKEVWCGTCPYYKLNDTKRMYQRNRYLVPEALAKAENEQTSENVFEAKNCFNEMRSARNLSFDHGCRTENCVAQGRNPPNQFSFNEPKLLKKQDFKF